MALDANPNASARLVRALERQAKAQSAYNNANTELTSANAELAAAKTYAGVLVATDGGVYDANVALDKAAGTYSVPGGW